MKSKLMIHKSRSPVHYNFSRDGEIANEYNETKGTKQIPNALLVNRQGDKFGNKAFNVTGLYRKARSNSPKDPLKKASKDGSRKNSPLCNSRNKIINVCTSYKTGKSSPQKYKCKVSPKSNKQRKKLSPPRIGKSPENEDNKLHKSIAKKKHKLNKELWDAAETGDLNKIGQLLDSYFKI